MDGIWEISIWNWDFSITFSANPCSNKMSDSLDWNASRSVTNPVKAKGIIREQRWVKWYDLIEYFRSKSKLKNEFLFEFTIFEFFEFFFFGHIFLNIIVKISSIDTSIW